MPVRHRHRARPWDEVNKKAKVSMTEADRFYNSKPWRATSTEFLSRNEFCECPDCDEREEAGKDRLIATCTDHVIPIQVGGDKWNEDNFQAMNKKICHQKKRGRERHGYVEPYVKGAQGLLPVRVRKHVSRF